jgi:hypothetical protein
MSREEQTDLIEGKQKVMKKRRKEKKKKDNGKYNYRKHKLLLSNHEPLDPPFLLFTPHNLLYPGNGQLVV